MRLAHRFQTWGLPGPWTRAQPCACPGGPAPLSLLPSPASSPVIFLVLALVASFRFHCVPGAQPRPEMECVLSKYLFNEWMIDVYLFNLHEADGLLALTVW